LLVERLVAMLVPAAAAIMAIIDGLKAAWATASRILAAFKLFFAFLRAVKGGNGGQPFAKALAAAAIAVIDFIANFLISKLMKGAKNVGSKLKGIADKLVAFFRKGAALAKRGASAVKKAVVTAAKWTGKQIARAGKAIMKSPVGKALRTAASSIAKSSVGKFAVAQYKKVRDGIKRAVDAIKRRRRKPQTEADKTARRDRVVAAVRPRLTSMLSRGVAGLRMRATLSAWRLWYRIRQLALVGREIVAANSPSVAIMNVMVADSAMIMDLVRSIGLEVLHDPRVVAAEERVAAQRAAGKGTSAKNPLLIGTGVDLLGGARDVSLIHSGRKRNPLFGTKTASGLPHDRFITPRRHVGTSEFYGLPGVKRPITFSEQQKGGSAGLVFIPQLGDYGIDDPKRDVPWKWIEARKALGPGGGKPLTDAELAGTLRRYMREGTFDDAVVGTKTRSGNPAANRQRSLKFLGGMSRLMGSVESGRDPSAIVDSSVLLGLMERKRVSAANAFEQEHSASALYPSALSGAFAANTAAAQRTLALPESQNLVDSLAARKISQERAREHEATLRRLRLIGELVHERMQLAEEMFTNEAAVRHFIEQNLRNLLYAEIEATYNLNLKAKVLLYDASGRPMVFH
ncbi:MAG: hypothetical protein M3154_04005, partial [Candidatus Eremiobacteraeota bacterium]|nr:hypothetical protein [Candidatus Eremiobacteraeota bacterium]